jgi:hypothetical protein
MLEENSNGILEPNEAGLIKHLTPERPLMNWFLYVLVLLLALTTSQFASAATRLYKQGFETPVETNPEIEWISAGYPLSQKIVSVNPREGTKSVRGNFNRNKVDPITKMAGDPFPHFKIYLKNIPKVKDWYKTTDKAYVSYWFKLDKCLWSGSDFANTNPLNGTAKFLYIRMDENPATSYYLSLGDSSTGEGILQVNDTGWMSLWEQWYKKYSLWTTTGQPYGTDGQWHQLSFFVGKAGGQKYMSWWIDGKLMRKDDVEPDGKFKISNTFIMDSLQFWITRDSAVDSSKEIDPNDTSNFCNGWQIDDVEIWDDIPTEEFSDLRCF